mmetsp:Transcript_8950/g.1296  ORF Transcript_8950/g.1296 Transcript_8950/m.1296 type:complete len:89 (+) Transcript_8950:67-333(+)
MVTGADKGPYNAGPLWIYNDLEYNESSDSTQVVVQAPYMATPVDYWISSAAGFHYCKVLSPARVMEWMYIDSLRLNASIEEEDEILVD